MLTHGGTMTIWMKQMKRKTREAQATYAPNLESTCLEYCRRNERRRRRGKQQFNIRQTTLLPLCSSESKERKMLKSSAYKKTTTREQTLSWLRQRSFGCSRSTVSVRSSAELCTHLSGNFNVFSFQLLKSHKNKNLNQTRA